LGSETRALKHWTPVHVHIGAAAVTGRVALLEGSELAPGAAALAQLVLDRPVGAVHGDCVILRDQSASRTVGGGAVVDIFPPRRGRARPERLAALGSLEASDAEALAALVAAAPAGFDLDGFAAGRNLAAVEAARLFEATPMRAIAGTPRLAVAPSRWAELKATAVKALEAWHRRAPDAPAPSAERLFASAGVKLDRSIADAVAAELVGEGAAVREGAGLRLPGQRQRLGAADEALWRKAEPLIARAGLRAPSLHELAQAMGVEARPLEAALARVARLGFLVRVSLNRFFRPDAVHALARIAAAVAADASQRRITAALFRDRSGVGRNVAIELLEYFDRVKFTRRIGDAHEVVRSVEEIWP
ncbi:MAG: SelB C-terminal domain-containing protein, partial [Stellaceae bacterium]